MSGVAWESVILGEVKQVCSYIADDGYVAAYFGIPRQIVANVRSELPPPRLKRTDPYVSESAGSGLSALAEAEHEARCGSQRLNDALQDLFQRWEDKHGFRPGAGQYLLPRGWAA